MPQIKLGIYLGCRPGAGGIFQYSLSLLDALAALPQGGYDILAAYEYPEWEPYLKELNISAMHVGGAGGERKTPGWWWGKFCLPTALWNLGIWRLDETAKFFAASHRDAWIFPSQDHWTYLSRVPAIGVVHDLMHRYEPEFPEVSSFGRRFLRDHRFRNIVHASRALLVDSELGKQQLTQSYGPSPAIIYPLPYVPPRYIYGETPTDFTARFPLPLKYFFYPAQFWPHKNHKRLLATVAAMRQEFPDVHLVLAGAKNHAYAEIVSEAQRLGLEQAVTFPGYVPDAYLPEMYRRARALVMPTFFGPTNIPPLEAMALGCPVAVSGIYAMPEQLGDAALYFDPRSVNEMQITLARLWQDDALCQNLSQRGYAKLTAWNQKLFNARFENILVSAGLGH